MGRSYLVDFTTKIFLYTDDITTKSLYLVSTKGFYTRVNICWFLPRSHYICVCVVYNRAIHCEATWRSKGQRRLSTTTFHAVMKGHA